MKNNELKFEQAVEELENIVSRLESGALALDESISEFEKAVGLIKICEEKLSAAKQKVRILTEDKYGAVSDMPFFNDAQDET